MQIDTDFIIFCHHFSHLLEWQEKRIGQMFCSVEIAQFSYSNRFRFKKPPAVSMSSGLLNTTMSKNENFDLEKVQIEWEKSGKVFQQHCIMHMRDADLSIISLIFDVLFLQKIKKQIQTNKE